MSDTLNAGTLCANAENERPAQAPATHPRMLEIFMAATIVPKADSKLKLDEGGLMLSLACPWE